MAQITVGLRQLKEQLSHYMEQVKTGSTVIVTERGTPVGRIVPEVASLDARLQQLEQAKLLAWSGRKLRPRVPTVRVRGPRTVSELLLEDRE